METAPNVSLRKNKNKSGVPAIGRDFDLTEVTQYEESKTRNRIALSTVIMTLSMVVVSGTYGMLNSDFVPVATVWSISGPILGGIFGHYFRPRKDSG